MVMRLLTDYEYQDRTLPAINLVPIVGYRLTKPEATQSRRRHNEVQRYRTVASQEQAMQDFRAPNSSQILQSTKCLCTSADYFSSSICFDKSYIP